MLIELINYEIKGNDIQYNFFKNGIEDCLMTEIQDKEKYTDYDFALNFIKSAHDSKKQTKKQKSNKYVSKVNKLSLVDINLLGYTKSKNIIEYTYELNNKKRNAIVIMNNKHKDYTNEQTALNLIKNKISNSFLDCVINDDIKIKRTMKEKKRIANDDLKKEEIKQKVSKINSKIIKKKERKIYPTILSEGKAIVLTKEPELVETSDEELNCILKEIMTIDESSKIELLKELIDDFANNLYLVRNDFNEEEKKGIAKIYSYYFNLHFKSKKTRDKVREFLENSESSNMIKIILNIY